jgi:hypothetical protein
VLVAFNTKQHTCIFAVVALALNQLGPVCSNGEAGDDAEEGQQQQRGADFKLVRKMVDRAIAEREARDESSDFDD